MTVNDDKNIMDNGDFKRPGGDNPVQRIKVIGVGGGGNNAVKHMYRKGIKDVSFVLLNTDRQVLESIEVPNKVLIGPGRGAGGDPERARKFAEESAEQIAALFEDETDMVFITAGMGGGTGTGAAPVVARIAKEKGILTVGIVTLPFKFEGRKKVLKAYEGAEEMARNVDSLLVINNERLTEIYHKLDIFNAFARADDTLLNAAQSIADIITITGIINRDFNDVDTTLRDGGTAIISSGYGEGPDRVQMAIEDALHSPLLKNTDIYGSKKLLMILYVSDDSENHPFNMEEVASLREFVASIDNEVDVMWGLYPMSDLGDKVRITILASGFDVTNDDNATPVAKPVAKGNNDSKKEDDFVNGYYGSDAMARYKGVVLNPDSYDDPDDDALKDLENRPAYSRGPYTRIMNSNGKNSFRGNFHSVRPSDTRGDSDSKAAAQKNEDSRPNGVTLDFKDM